MKYYLFLTLECILALTVGLLGFFWRAVRTSFNTGQIMYDNAEVNFYGDDKTEKMIDKII